MKFKIIQNEQTPKIEIPKPAELLISQDYKLLDKFISFASRQHNCAGLAANQVSVNSNRIMEKFFAIKNNHHWEIVINPVVLHCKGKKEEKIERCLTWIGKRIKVNRSPEISVKYYNFKGEKLSTSIIDYEAQVWQHEYDHLMGIEEIFV